MTINRIRSITTIANLIPFLLALIIFLYPIPGSGFARNILFLSISILIIYSWQNYSHNNTFKFSQTASQIKYPIISLYILTLWMYIQTIIFAVDKFESITNLLEEWTLGAIIFSWLTWKIAHISTHGSRKSSTMIITWMLIAMFAHIAWMFWHQIPVWYDKGTFPYGATPYAQRDYMSWPVNIAFIILISDLASTITLNKRILNIPIWGVTILSIIATAGILAVHTRNGVLSSISAILLFAMATGYKLWKEQRQKTSLLMVIMAFSVISVLIIGSINNDARWSQLTSYAERSLNAVSDIATIDPSSTRRNERLSSIKRKLYGVEESFYLAIDIKNNKAWLDRSKYPLPVKKDGTVIDSSFYDRVAWATVTIEGIKKHPLGYGYGLGAAGKYIEEEYNYKHFVSSHSGILDFTLANGIPGAILWIIFCIILLWSSWSLFNNGNPLGIVLMLMLANFFTRTTLDGHFGGFRLKIFALFMGALFYLAMSQKKLSPPRIPSER